MISCKDFIPAYSEFFKYLEEKHGHGEVLSFWESLFVPDGKGIPLVNFVAKSGIRGCFDYWAHSLNEEAADFTMYLNEKRGFSRSSCTIARPREDFWNCRTRPALRRIPITACTAITIAVRWKSMA